MKWKKLGRIFNPVEHKLANGCEEFAQSPQTLVFENYVRIYFSTRAKEPEGKFLSHIAYADFSKDFGKLLNVTSHTVISLGERGCFDEHGIFPINILQDNDKIFAYTCGWSRRVSVPVETSTGLAISYDEGMTFQKMGNGPILSSTPNEPFLVGDSFVRKFDQVYHMWYIFGTKWTEAKDEGPARVYKISHATSNDGINWKKEEGKQIITDVLNPDECQALPSVIFHKGIYHMVFCYREATDFRKNPRRGYRLGYARSKDLALWQRADADLGIDLSKEGWDSEMMCYPHIFECDGKIYLLYNGNEFGRWGFGMAVLEE